MDIYKKPYKNSLVKIFKKNKSKIFFDHDSDAVICNFDGSDLVSLVIFKKLSFPYVNHYEFHVEIFKKNKFIGATRIINSLNFLETYLDTNCIISRHTKNENHTLAMLNSLGFSPIEYLMDDPRSIILKKNNSLKKTLNHTSIKDLNSFINHWLDGDFQFNTIDNFIIEFENLLNKNDIHITKISMGVFIIVNRETSQGLIFSHGEIRRQSIMKLVYFIRKTNLKDIFVPAAESVLNQVLFLEGYNNNFYNINNFTRHSLDIV